MSRGNVAVVLLAVLVGWLTKPGQGLAVLALLVVTAVGVAELVAAHRRGRRRLKRAGY